MFYRIVNAYPITCFLVIANLKRQNSLTRLIRSITRWSIWLVVFKCNVIVLKTMISLIKIGSKPGKRLGDKQKLCRFAAITN